MFRQQSFHLFPFDQFDVKQRSFMLCIAIESLIRHGNHGKLDAGKPGGIDRRARRHILHTLPPELAVFDCGALALNQDAFAAFDGDDIHPAISGLRRPDRPGIAVLAPKQSAEGLERIRVERCHILWINWLVSKRITTVRRLQVAEVRRAHIARTIQHVGG